MTDLIKGSIWPWEKTDLIARLLAEETDLTDCAADHIKQTEAKLTKAMEALRFYSPQTVGGITFVGGDDAGKRAAAVLAELEGK
jgi:hypothetical protein